EALGLAGQHFLDHPGAGHTRADDDKSRATCSLDHRLLRGESLCRGPAGAQGESDPWLPWRGMNAKRLGLIGGIASPHDPGEEIGPNHNAENGETGNLNRACRVLQLGFTGVAYRSN